MSTPELTGGSTGRRHASRCANAAPEEPHASHNPRTHERPRTNTRVRGRTHAEGLDLLHRVQRRHLQPRCTLIRQPHRSPQQGLTQPRHIMLDQPASVLGELRQLRLTRSQRPMRHEHRQPQRQQHGHPIRPRHTLRRIPRRRQRAVKPARFTPRARNNPRVCVQQPHHPSPL